MYEPRQITFCHSSCRVCLANYDHLLALRTRFNIVGSVDMDSWNGHEAHVAVSRVALKIMKPWHREQRLQLSLLLQCHECGLGGDCPSSGCRANLAW